MTHKLTTLAIVPALALTLAACGSSNTDTGASSSTSSMSSMSPSGSSTTIEPPKPTPSATADAAAVVISITDFAYKVPESVPPGATITIKNADSQAHSVTSKEGGFDVKVDPDGTATLTAPSKPGSYPIVCTFHGNMTSALVVT